eukprot:365196-Chlamydomonas_euryale.AAC.11
MPSHGLAGTEVWHLAQAHACVSPYMWELPATEQHVRGSALHMRRTGRTIRHDFMHAAVSMAAFSLNVTSRATHIHGSYAGAPVKMPRQLQLRSHRQCLCKSHAASIIQRRRLNPPKRQRHGRSVAGCSVRERHWHRRVGALRLPRDLRCHGDDRPATTSVRRRVSSRGGEGSFLQTNVHNAACATTTQSGSSRNTARSVVEVLRCSRLRAPWGVAFLAELRPSLRLPHIVPNP